MRKRTVSAYNLKFLIFSSWDLNTFIAMTPEERDAIIKALNDDAHKLLSELEPNDPLVMRLKEELKLTNEHFYNLLNQMNRPKGIIGFTNLELFGLIMSLII